MGGMGEVLSAYDYKEGNKMEQGQPGKEKREESDLVGVVIKSEGY